MIISTTFLSMSKIRCKLSFIRVLHKIAKAWLIALCAFVFTAMTCNTAAAENCRKRSYCSTQMHSNERVIIKEVERSPRKLSPWKKRGSEGRNNVIVYADDYGYRDDIMLYSQGRRSRDNVLLYSGDRGAHDGTYLYIYK